MRILFKYASRSRPELFERGLRSIIDNCESDDYRILISIDNIGENKDERLDEYNEVINRNHHPSLIVLKGESKNKIDAINRDVEFVGDWDILVNMSDDMVFIKKGFDNIIRKAFTDKNEFMSTVHGEPMYNRNYDLALHFSDGNRNDLITMAILGREFYDRFGYIYHPAYKSLYCDNEMTEVSRQLDCYKYVDEQIVRHLHCAYDSKLWDNQYVKTESYMDEDRQTFLLREQTNFDL